ncbi:MAG: hypothetical protein FWG36_00795 [Oscillospiraceae bacterium]|nr:hypothetical protein [Oscillospiraceae bacterium]
MVKGISKRVVVVRFPDTRVFEQAIFIVREDEKYSAVSSDKIVDEACRVAESYVQKKGARGLRRLSPLAFLMAGAGGVGVIWGLTWLMGLIR